MPTQNQISLNPMDQSRTHARPWWRRGAAVCLLALCLPLAVQGDEAASSQDAQIFNEALKALQPRLERGDEQAAMEILQLGLERVQPYQSNMVISGFLGRVNDPSAALLLEAARAAVRAGDDAQAVSRFKSYLAQASDNDAASQVAAELYHVQVDLLGNHEDAYRTMVAHDTQFRRSLAARRFEPWLVNQARQRGDLPVMARRLELILRDRMPMEQERQLYWDHLDWLFEQLAVPTDNMDVPAAISAATALPDLLRDDARRPLRWKFNLQHLGFVHAASGLEGEAMERAFVPVNRAARAYFDVLPDGESFRDIWSAYLGGPHTWLNQSVWRMALNDKQIFTVESFPRLGASDKRAILNWVRSRYMGPYLASEQQWAILGNLEPQLFATTRGTAHLNLVLTADNLNIFREQAGFVGQLESWSAAMVRSMALAQGEDGLEKAATHLMEKESWALTPRQISDGLGRMWTSFRSFSRPDDQALPADYGSVFYGWFGRQYVWSSPLALLDTTLARDTLSHAWRSQGGDRMGFVADLDALRWVPYTPQQREAVFTQSHNEVKQWTDRTVRRALEAAQARQGRATQAVEAATKALQDAREAFGEAEKDAANERQLNNARQQVTTRQAALQQASDEMAQAAEQVATQQTLLASADAIEQAYRRLLSAEASDPTAAPNDPARLFAQAIVARRANNLDDFLAAARPLYALLRQYDQRHAVLGQTLLENLLNQRSTEMDLYDFQLEVLRDQLGMLDAATFDPLGTDARQRVSLVLTQIMDGQRWRWGQIPADDQRKAMVLNSVLAAGLESLVSRDQYWPQLFQWVRTTRRGRGWAMDDANEALMRQMIEKRTLIEHNHVVHGSSPVVSYQFLVQGEWPGLREAFPPERYFDDLFVEEIRRRERPMDINYWRLGRDEQQKVRRAAAEVLATYAYLPFGWTPQHAGPVYSDRNEFFNWQYRVYEADASIWQPMHNKLLGYFGQSRYDVLAAGRGWFQRNITLDDDTRNTYFQTLDSYLDRSAQVAYRMTYPNTAALGNVRVDQIDDAMLAVLLRAFAHPGQPQNLTPGQWQAGNQHGQLIRPILESLQQRQANQTLVDMAGPLWRIARDVSHASFRDVLVQYTQNRLRDQAYELAAIYAGAGITLGGEALGGDTLSALRSAQARSLVEISSVMLVDRSDPLYPIFQAQANYLSGRQGAAWSQYLQHPGMVERALDRLDPQFVIWLIRQNAQQRRFDASRQLVRLMAQWMDRAGTSVDESLRAQLLLAEADTSFIEQEYPRARAQYERIAQNERFDATQAQREAMLRIANVDRLTQNYDSAVRQLEQLSRRPDRALQVEAFHLLARTMFDQEAFMEANRFVQEALLRDPGHAETKILQGQIFIRLNQLEPATQIETGLRTDQRFLRPGEPLRVTLEDRNLAVVGADAEIRLRITTSGGDEEILHLFPFADSQTRFQGQIRTVLGTVQPNDNILQLRGGDTVTYDFADRDERELAASGPPPALMVVTEAQLAVSSSAILSRQQQAQLMLEERIRERLQQEQTDSAPLSQQRRADQIKPGNPINVRVIDPDRSVSAQRDQLTVQVTASSGDIIERFVLSETEPDTGVFEGAVPTAPGHAVAFATDAREGHDPNFVISARDYPAWQALPDNVRPKHFTVDLNDNVALGTMRIDANVPGRRLRQWLIQRSLDGRNFETLGGWPQAVAPWDGTPRVAFVRVAGEEPDTYQALRDYVSYNHLGHDMPKVVETIETLADQLDGTVNRRHSALELNNVHDLYIAHYQAAFVQIGQRTRTFRIDPKGRTGNIRYLLVIDGQPAGAANAMQIERTLEPGVHTVEIFVISRRHAQPRFELLVDIDEPPFVIPAPASMFDPTLHPQITRALAARPATITADDAGSRFDVRFDDDTRARMVRLVISDYETDAPAIEKIHLSDAQGETLLPAAEDFLALRRNQILEILPGDRVTVVYEDPTPVRPERQVHEASLQATYSNAVISAAYVRYRYDPLGNAQPVYESMRRFQPGDRVTVFVNDPDSDTSPERDVITVQAQVGDRQPVNLRAVETEPHSGIFIAALFPVRHEPSRQGEIQIGPDQDIVLRYLDRENIDPGIPWERTASIEQVRWQTPQLRVYEMTSHALDEAARQASARPGTVGRDSLEYVPSHRDLRLARPDEPLQDTATMLLPGPLVVEALYPPAARSPQSELELVIQTSRGRAALGRDLDENTIDPDVPGTINLAIRPGDIDRTEVPAGYRRVNVVGDHRVRDPLDHGRFTVQVPLELGPLPEASLVRDLSPEQRRGALRQEPLAVRGDDRIYIGLKYEDEAGQSQWLVRHVDLISDGFLDVMDRRYLAPLDAAYVGESLYLRVIEPVASRSEQSDRISVTLTTSDGSAHELELTETLSHSGMFKGFVQLVHEADEQGRADALEGIPVRYGDTVSIAYQPRHGEDQQIAIPVHLGADGEVMLFSKRFNDAAIAVQTQFTIAEAYFEQAKRYRELEQQELARRAIAQGRRLLQEAMRDYPDADARAQAEYLLANLAYEYAQDARNEQVRDRHYVEAITLLSNIVARYPESPYAPQSQFKKALVLEKMGDIDQASEEYVKLVYRYPDHDLVAETIARLGRYFLARGQQMIADADKLEDPVQAEVLRTQSRDMLRTAAEVFGRLAPRFPSHQLAGQTTVLAGQCYMRAGMYDQAVATFARYLENPQRTPQLGAEAMYWMADSYALDRNLIEAYRTFRRLTWDYPESNWARFARTRLTEESMVRIEQQETRR